MKPLLIFALKFAFFHLKKKNPAQYYIKQGAFILVNCPPVAFNFKGSWLMISYVSNFSYFSLSVKWIWVVWVFDHTDPEHVNAAHVVLTTHSGCDQIIRHLTGEHALQKYNNVYHLTIVQDGLRPYIKQWPGIDSISVETQNPATCMAHITPIVVSV